MFSREIVDDKKKKKKEKKNPKLVVLKFQGFALLLKKRKICVKTCQFLLGQEIGVQHCRSIEKKCLVFSFFFAERV